MNKVREAAKWVLEQVDGKECPFCAWRAQDHSDKHPLSLHLRTAHKAAIVSAFEQQTLTPVILTDEVVETTEEVLASVGIEEVDERFKYNYLAIPDDIKKKAEADGATLRWVAPRNIGTFRTQGATIVPLSGEGGAKQGSTEGPVKTKELTLMRFEAPVAEKRRQINASKIENRVASCAEELRGSGSDTEKILYDHYRKNEGLDHQKALQIARAQSRRAETNVSLRIRDQQGDHAY